MTNLEQVQNPENNGVSDETFLEIGRKLGEIIKNAGSEEDVVEAISTQFDVPKEIIKIVVIRDNPNFDQWADLPHLAGRENERVAISALKKDGFWQQFNWENGNAVGFGSKSRVISGEEAEALTFHPKA